MSEEKKDYSAQSIKVIEGLEAVRKRPAMYIGSTGPQGLHHLVYEIVDNSVDEALAGYCTQIKVVIHTDSSCSVLDNGRGIPTEIHPTEGVSAAEVALTKLHAGGKFDKDTYKFSGGLHGVGVSVVNALSEWLNLTIYRNGTIYYQEYSRGKPLCSLHEAGTTAKRGTLVHFKPDPLIFKETVELNFDTLSARLRELAFLNKGLTISIFDERTTKEHEFYFQGGIVSFVEFINSKKTTLFPEIISCTQESDQYALELALQYNDGFGEQLYSFVNNINTVEGGTHVTGFKAALTKACNKRAQEFGMLKEHEAFSSEDVREGLVAVINLKAADPQFEGQTKAKLGNSEAKGIVESWVFSFLDTYFEEHPAIARKILQKAELALQAREAAKKARELTRRKSALESSILPGKLADCSAEHPRLAEMFIVEGESAGGSAKQARDRHTQAILPIRGKILNVEKARLDKILANEEIKSLISAIGCGVSDEFNLEKARYHKIILMTDADVDGSHICTLLLTFFFRYMRPLIEAGYLYIAQPPLFKAKIGKKEQYLKDETHLQSFLFSWAQESTTLTTHEGPLQTTQQSPDIWASVMAWYQDVQQRAHVYRITAQQMALLLQARIAWGNTENPEQIDTARIAHVLAPLVAPWHVQVVPGETVAGDMLVMTHKSKSWSVLADCLTNEQTTLLAQRWHELATRLGNWTLQVTDRPKGHLSGQDVLPLVDALTAISKPYMTIQRYKGLGEMNPEQLWETAMDPQRRQLLQVTIGDALQADAWFDTLMGDDASGRKRFIEENGRFVKHLDV